MIIAIIDADIIGKSKHRFPNLACMKISAFYKKQGEVVLLKTDFKHLDAYDKIFISKVFTESFVPPFVLRQENVTFGGTGFFYDQAPTLPDEIEHIMPDYHLYDDWVQEKIRKGARQNEFKYYQDYSIGFLTRGCFRGCAFCVNRNYKQSKRHGNVYEFYDETRPKLCFLDDNFLACKDWKSIIEEVKGLNRRFQFKQGLDERLLNNQIIDEIVSWKYEGDLIFAFDDIDDREIVESKLKIFHEKYPKRCKKMKFYVLCGYDSEEKWDEDFWVKDIETVFKRCFILSKYGVRPYIMRYKKAYSSPWSTVYSNIASWCNQPKFYATFSFREYFQCSGMRKADFLKYGKDIDGYLSNVGIKGKSWRDCEYFEQIYPAIANQYFGQIPNQLKKL